MNYISNNGKIAINKEIIYTYYCAINLYLETYSQHSSLHDFATKNKLNCHKFKNMYYLIHRLTLQSDYKKHIDIIREFSPQDANLKDFCIAKNITYNRGSSMLRHLKYLEIIKQMKLKESSLENKSPTSKELKSLEFIEIKNVPTPSVPFASPEPIQETSTKSVFIDITINEVKFQLPSNFSAERITKIIQFIKEL